MQPHTSSEPTAKVPVQCLPASPALAPALRTISGERHRTTARARFEVAAADGADAAEAVKEIVMGWLHAKGLDVPEGRGHRGARGLDGRRRARRHQGRPLSRFPIRRARRAWAVEADELDGSSSRRRWQ